MRNDIRGILFDKDGTLFDFHATWSAWCAEFIAELAGDDIALTHRLSDAIGYDQKRGTFRSDSPMIAGTSDVLMGIILETLPDLEPPALRETILRTTSATMQVEAAPLVPLINHLSAQGYVLGVATNDSEAPARAHLRQADIEASFHFIAGFDSGFGAKPGAGMPLAFAGATGLPPEACVMVGDSTHDLISGRAAGMKTVAVLTGIADEGDLAPHADEVMHNISALPEWLGAPMTRMD